jgi:hypothetical protein
VPGVLIREYTRKGKDEGQAKRELAVAHQMLQNRDLRRNLEIQGITNEQDQLRFITDQIGVSEETQSAKSGPGSSVWGKIYGGRAEQQQNFVRTTPKQWVRGGEKQQDMDRPVTFTGKETGIEGIPSGLNIPTRGTTSILDLGGYSDKERQGEALNINKQRNIFRPTGERREPEANQGLYTSTQAMGVVRTGDGDYRLAKEGEQPDEIRAFHVMTVPEPGSFVFDDAEAGELQKMMNPAVEQKIYDEGKYKTYLVPAGGEVLGQSGVQQLVNEAARRYQMQGQRASQQVAAPVAPLPRGDDQQGGGTIEWGGF